MENALRACCKGIKIGKNSSRPEGQRRPAELALRASSEQRVPVPPTLTRRVRSVSRVAMEAAIDSPSSHLPERENGTRSGEGSPNLPRVVYEKLPADINDRYVPAPRSHPRHRRVLHGRDRQADQGWGQAGQDHVRHHHRGFPGDPLAVHAVPAHEDHHQRGGRGAQRSEQGRAGRGRVSGIDTSGRRICRRTTTGDIDEELHFE